MTGKDIKLRELFKKNRLVLDIVLFLFNYNGFLSAREIPESILASKPKVYKALYQLEELGFVKKDRYKRQTFYALKRDGKNNEIIERIFFSLKPRQDAVITSDGRSFIGYWIMARIGDTISDVFEPYNVQIIDNKVVKGEYWRHEFDIAIIDKIRIGINVNRPDEYHADTLFYEAGKWIDIPKK